MFSQHNVRTVMGTAQAGAVAIVCAARRGLPVALHTPSEVKAAVTGSGRADKAQVTQMVTRLLALADPPRPADAADALALAICHLWRGGAQRRLAAAAAAHSRPARWPVPRRPPRRPAHPEPEDDMIAHLNGTVASVAPDGAVIDVGGVGLLVQCTPGTLAGLRPGERARVATSLVVREDALTLYGFAGDDERNTFELLQTASGVGPRLALAMLAVFTPDALRRAVATEDLTALTTVPGIGRKGAAADRARARRAARLARRRPARRIRGGPGRPRGQGRGRAVAGSGAGGPGEPGLAGPRRRPGHRRGGAGTGGRGRPGRAVRSADGSQAVDVSVALRAALRVLGRT